jgi:hypothetical protein
MVIEHFSSCMISKNVPHEIGHNPDMDLSKSNKVLSKAVGPNLWAFYPAKAFLNSRQRF